MRWTTSAMRQLVAVAILWAGAVGPMAALAQEKPYTEGTVWVISMIRVTPGMLDVYLRDFLPLRKKMTDEATKQGLLVSSRILSGNSMGRDDWDVMILEEYRNWAAFDGISARFEALAARIIGPEDSQLQLMTKRADVREVLGTKVMQELMPR